MDSEISKIWEEALRYASPLPIPGEFPTEDTSGPKKLECQPTNIDINDLVTLHTTAGRNQPASSSSINSNVDNTCKPVPISSVYSNLEHAVKQPISRVDGALNDGTSLIENENASEINNAHEIRLPVTELGTRMVLPYTLSGSSPPSLTDQIYQLTKQQAMTLEQKDPKEVSDALAVGLKMIQQGNELIAKALKLSNTKTEGNGLHTYASMSPASVPSSLESVINVDIPYEPTVENIESDNIRQEFTQPMVVLSDDNYVSSPGNFSDILDKEKDISYVDNDNTTTDAKTGEPKVKRKRRREKNPNPEPCAPVLPPCRVCDEKSSGFHYGANTCEACKGFFRRTLKKQEVKFPCKCREEEKLAWKKGPVKNICPACRYERCLFVGMSKNAIKIGRYTLNRKTENIREVKSLEAMDSLIDKAICSSVNVDSQSGLQSPSTGSTISSSESMSISEPSFSTESPSCTTSTESFSPITLQSGMSIKEIQTIVKDITEAHKSSQVHDPTLVNRPKEVVNQVHKKYLEDYKLKEKVFGNMKPLSKEEYKEFYNLTGIDIDGRQEALEEGLQHFTKKIVQFVEYAKTIPGFSDLSTQDQASLIKYSRPEHVILAGYRSMIRNLSPDLQVCTTPWGKEIHLNDIGRIIPRDMMVTRFKYAKRLYNIGLTIEEEAILRGIVITFSDRCELEDPELVQEIQYKLITCLDYLTSLRQTNSRKIFHQILDILVRFRNFSEQEYKVTKEMVFDWPCMSSYTLLRELFF